MNANTVIKSDSKTLVEEEDPVGELLLKVAFITVPIREFTVTEYCVGSDVPNNSAFQKVFPSSRPTTISVGTVRTSLVKGATAFSKR